MWIHALGSEMRPCYILIMKYQLMGELLGDEHGWGRGWARKGGVPGADSGASRREDRQAESWAKRLLFQALERCKGFETKTHSGETRNREIPLSEIPLRTVWEGGDRVDHEAGSQEATSLGCPIHAAGFRAPSEGNCWAILSRKAPWLDSCCENRCCHGANSRWKSSRKEEEELTPKHSRLPPQAPMPEPPNPRGMIKFDIYPAKQQLLIHTACFAPSNATVKRNITALEKWGKEGKKTTLTHFCLKHYLCERAKEKNNEWTVLIPSTHTCNSRGRDGARSHNPGLHLGGRNLTNWTITTAYGYVLVRKQ